MLLPDLLHLATASALRSRMRSVMLLLAMAIGVAAVVALTALGEGARLYVVGEFQSLGTRMVIVLPGRSETGGLAPGVLSGETPRDLTLSDAEAMLRIPGVERVAPLIIGAAPISAEGRERDAPVLGSTADFLAVYGFALARGHFLPQGDLSRESAVCVIGANIARELFPQRDAIGAHLRIGDRRFRVIGILGDKGRMIGLDSQELIIVPVSAAQALFNTDALFRVLVQTRSRDEMGRVSDALMAEIKRRHQGEADVTVITQDALLATFDRIFTALTMTLAGIASISLAVAGVLIMNVMLVAVSQRTAEVGLLKAIGATQRQITALFLTEAILLSIAGALAGLMLGFAAAWIAGQIYPALTLRPPLWAVMLAIGTAIMSGMVFGWLPAQRAAKLEPVAALAGRR